MKCTNKALLCLLLISTIFLCGCTGQDASFPVYQDSYGITSASSGNNPLFSASLAVSDGSDLHTEDVDSFVASGAGAFNIDTKQVLYAQNIYGKLYPASTTKILTAYIILQNANLDETVTVSENACDQTGDSSVANLSPGDHLTYRQLLYGMMLRSGNDAALALAEGYAGSEDDFAQLMNETAAKLGATHSHFITCNGLHDEDHYTTVYDMYLLFNAAIQNEEFVNIISTVSYDAIYTDANGDSKTQTWTNTNQYLTGHIKMPTGITVIGGKTGTTGDAGYCLVVLSENSLGQRIISIVFDADSRGNLYLLMNEILRNYAVPAETEEETDEANLSQSQ